MQISKDSLFEGILQVALLLSVLRSNSDIISDHSSSNWLLDNFANYDNIGPVAISQRAQFHNLHSVNGISVHPKSITSSNPQHSLPEAEDIFAELRDLGSYESYSRQFNSGLQEYTTLAVSTRELLRHSQEHIGGLNSATSNIESTPGAVQGSLVSVSEALVPQLNYSNEAILPQPNNSDVEFRSSVNQRAVDPSGFNPEHSENSRSSSVGSELSIEDMDLIDILWRQDIDLGISRDMFDADLKKKLEEEKELEAEKIKLKELETELPTNDPWAGLNFTVDCETGEYILIPDEKSENVDINANDVVPQEPSSTQHTILDNRYPVDHMYTPSNNPLGQEVDFFTGMRETNDLGTPESVNYQSSQEQFGEGTVATEHEPMEVDDDANVNNVDVEQAYEFLSGLLTYSTSDVPTEVTQSDPVTNQPDIQEDVSFVQSNNIPSTSSYEQQLTVDTNGTSPEVDNLPSQVVSNGSIPGLDELFPVVAPIDAKEANSSGGEASGGVTRQDSLELALAAVRQMNMSEEGEMGDFLSRLLDDDDEAFDEQFFALECASLLGSDVSQAMNDDSVKEEDDNDDDGSASFVSSDSAVSSLGTTASPPPHHSAALLSANVSHNHTYHAPPLTYDVRSQAEASVDGPATGDTRRKVRPPPRPPRRPQTSTSQEDDGQDSQSRDERRAKMEGLPWSAAHIAQCSVQHFNDMFTVKSLTERQKQLIRDIRRRGKNKLAAQNCRQRKLDYINQVEKELAKIKEQKFSAVKKQRELLGEVKGLRAEYDELVQQVFSLLTDDQGRPLNRQEYTIEHTVSGHTLVVPRDSGGAILRKRVRKAR